VQYQMDQCLYHNGASSAHVSLFTDHRCDREQIPCEASYVLRHHGDEVWFVQFSHNGKILASAGKDGAVILWDATSPSFAVLRTLAHNVPVSYVAWSPDDTLLLTCTDDADGALSLWDVASGTLQRTFMHHNGAVKACGWLPDGKAFVSGGVDKNVILCGTDGVVLGQFSAAQVNDLAVTNDGKRVIVVCQEKKIRIRSLVDRTETEIQEGDLVTSLALSSDNRHLLVNICSNSTETHMWDLTTKQIVQKFRGQKQGRFVVRSCFAGGFSEPFVASGSEGPRDYNVYIWHRYHGTLLETLSGHFGTVNSVAWNPSYPGGGGSGGGSGGGGGMLASASDDRTVRIWTSPRPKQPNNNNNNNNTNGRVHNNVDTSAASSSENGKPTR